MRGEEFFGEVEERLIDRDLSWLLVVSVVIQLVGFFVIYFYMGLTIRIESYWTWSYWLEVMGFALIVGDLFFEKQTKNLMSFGEGHFTPGDVNFMGWWRFWGFNFFSAFVGGLVAFIGYTYDFDLTFNWEGFLPHFSMGLAIFLGAYCYVLDKTNDRILANGVGYALTGLTFATSAQITTTFF